MHIGETLTIMKISLAEFENIFLKLKLNLRLNKKKKQFDN